MVARTHRAILLSIGCGAYAGIAGNPDASCTSAHAVGNPSSFVRSGARSAICAFSSRSADSAAPRRFEPCGECGPCMARAGKHRVVTQGAQSQATRCPARWTRGAYTQGAAHVRRHRARCAGPRGRSPRHCNRVRAECRRPRVALVSAGRKSPHLESRSVWYHLCHRGSDLPAGASLAGAQAPGGLSVWRADNACDHANAELCACPHPL